jgi:hypothetical protein
MNQGQVTVLSRGKSRTFLALFALPFLAAGIAMMVLWGIPTLQKAKTSTSWPTTRGVVIDSDMERKVDNGTGRHRSRSITYHAHVTYEYAVDGTEYNCSTVSFGQYGSSSRNHALQIVNRYPVGKTIEVHYDPDRPESAVLEPGVSFSSYLGLGLGGVFAVVGAVLLIAAIAAGRKTGSPTPQQPAPPLQGDYPPRL